MISVIVPVYKTAPYLRQCVDSILNQTYRDIEILLIDDGSPDECGEICDEYKELDKRIKVFHTKNEGLSAARNVGIENAAGGYIGFVDSDDWIEPDMYEMLLSGLTEADICVCGYGSAFQAFVFDGAVYKGADALRVLLDEKVNNNVWNKLYRRALFQGIRFPEGKNYEDVAVMHSIVDKAKAVAVISKVLYHYRIHPGSITKTYKAKNILDYADAYMNRYRFIEKKRANQYTEDKIQMIAAKGISKVWRWWYECSEEEKLEYNYRITELLAFTKKNIPMVGYRSWPEYLRLSAVFMHSNSNLSFAVLYALNQVFRKLCPDKANVV